MKDLIATLIIFGAGMAAMEWLPPAAGSLACLIIVLAALMWPGFTEPRSKTNEPD